MDRFISCSWKPATPVMGLRSPSAARRLMERQAVGGSTTMLLPLLRSLQLPHSHAYWRRRRRHCLMLRAGRYAGCCSWLTGMRDEAEMGRGETTATRCGSISCSVSTHRQRSATWQSVSRLWNAVHRSVFARHTHTPIVWPPSLHLLSHSLM